jgi:hypothetical protein
MSLYSPTLGITPQTREQMLINIHAYLSQEGIYRGDFNAFLGTNWHRMVSVSIIPMLEEQQAAWLEAQTQLFSFWQDNSMAVQGGMGASYEGMHNIFLPHCRGLNIVTYENDDTLGSAGNMSLYFDELTEESELRNSLFKKAMPIAIFTPLGTEQITVAFSGNNAKTFRFFTLKEEAYTALSVRVTLGYKSGTIIYPAGLVKESVQEQFDKTNRIGRGFYPDSYFDHALLPNIASMNIEHNGLDGQWSNSFLAAAFGQKYRIDSIEVVQ